MRGAIPVIVPNVGRPKLFLLGITIKLRKLLRVPFRYLPRFFCSRPSYLTELPCLLSEYRQTPFTLEDGLCEWKGQGGIMFAEFNKSLQGMLQLKQGSSFWELSSFVVSPQAQGQGIGRDMLRQSKQFVDLPLYLRVKRDNPAKRLYESEGFQTDCLSDGRYYMKYLK